MAGTNFVIDQIKAWAVG